MTRKTQPGTNWRVFWQSTTLLSSSSKAPGKATGSVSDRTHVRSLARRKSKWTIGGCGALRRCGCARTYEGTQFLCVKFRLGSAGEPTICSHCYDVLNEDMIQKLNYAGHFVQPNCVAVILPVDWYQKVMGDCWWLGTVWSYSLKKENITTGNSHQAVRNTWKWTLDVRGLSSLGVTRSISWLQMPWLLLSPGHQQPWYWLSRIGMSFSYLRKDFNYPCHINVEEWHKMYIYVFSPLKNLACKGLSYITMAWKYFSKNTHKRHTTPSLWKFVCISVKMKPYHETYIIRPDCT